MNNQKQMSNIFISVVTPEQEISIYIYPTTALEYSNWNPVLPSTFHGALISNYSFNINVYNNKKSSPSKRRRVIIEDDSN